MENLYRLPKLPALSWIRAIWKRKLLILVSWLLLGGVAMAVVFALPAVYRAEAVILVESQRIPERFVTPTVSADLNDRLSKLQQQILSYSRLLAIIKKYDLYKEKRKRLAEEEIIELMRKDTAIRLERGWSTEQPGAFRVSYENHNPAIAAQVANELAELFIDQNLRVREVNAVGTAEFLEDRLAEAKRRLEQQEAALTAYKRAHIGELPQQENNLIAALARLGTQLQGVQEQISRAEQVKTLRDSELEAAQQSYDSLSRLAAQRSASGSQTAGAVQEKESERLKAQLAALRARYTDSHPDVRAVREALALALQREAAQPEGATEQAASAAARPEDPAMQSSLVRERERLEQLKALQSVAAKQLEDLEAERKRVVEEMNSLQARIQKLPLHEQQLAALMRDYEISKANYQSLLDKRLAAEMATEMERNQKSERFTILEGARVPEKPVKPDRLILSIAGWIVGLLLALGAGLLIEFNKNCLLGEWELPAGVPVLGRVPAIEIGAATGRITEQPAGD